MTFKEKTKSPTLTQIYIDKKPSPTDEIYADFWSRLLAHNIDLLFIIGAGYAITAVIEISSLILLPAFYLIFHVSFEASPWESTPGKRIMRIHIRSQENKKVRFLQVLVRNAMKFISLLFLFSGFVMINFTKRNQGLHDIIAGCIVVFVEKENKFLNSP